MLRYELHADDRSHCSYPSICALALACTEKSDEATDRPLIVTVSHSLEHLLQISPHQDLSARVYLQSFQATAPVYL
jgi:hypothetical protein